jgi:hypothetical protein
VPAAAAPVEAAVGEDAADDAVVGLLLLGADELELELELHPAIVSAAAATATAPA